MFKLCGEGYLCAVVPESELNLSTAAAIIHVEDEATGEVDDIIVKKEVGAERDDQDDDNEDVVVGAGKTTNQMELSQEDGAAQEVQVSGAPPNGDLTPEMILSMMDRWWMWDPWSHLLFYSWQLGLWTLAHPVQKQKSLL